tara:strand:+ start:10176 stop:10427 length:252 start_codon:yes stop_codon:yes gene_type:complete
MLSKIDKIELKQEFNQIIRSAIQSPSNRARVEIYYRFNRLFSKYGMSLGFQLDFEDDDKLIVIRPTDVISQLIIEMLMENSYG